ncbi:MAG: PIN domain-containing protein [Victivallales bacterium]|nr:PIN domain-containing protein [Victivallales bacterium]
MIFLDSNIWCYALLSQEQSKRERALAIIESACSGGDFCISTQVISECANVLFTKGHLSPQQVMSSLHYIKMVNTIVDTTSDIIDRAVEIKALYGLPFYDSQIIAAAEWAGCSTIWSDDLGDGQVYSGVYCVNPFKH